MKLSNLRNLINEGWEEIGIADPDVKDGLKDPKFNARIYYKMRLWPGIFAELGFIKRKHSYISKSPDNKEMMAFTAKELFIPPSDMIKQILQLPDENWIAAIKSTNRVFMHTILRNIKIINKKWHAYNDKAGELQVEYEVDVNLNQFFKASDWTKKDVDEMKDDDDFRILKRY